MSGKRAAGGWGPGSTALLVTASVAMVVWFAVAASMLFASHPAVPVERTAQSSTPSPSPMTGGTTLPPALYSATPYDGPLPSWKTRKPETVTPSPWSTASTSGGPTYPTSYPTSPTPYPTYPSPTLPTIYPTTSSPTPTHGHGHTHGPH
ncbi:MAG TPA: hypothetical protein VGJ41_13000 [Nocardioides sp.]